MNVTGTEEWNTCEGGKCEGKFTLKGVVLKTQVKRCTCEDGIL